jgi:transcriptional regulator with XRE-family HTH domain
MNEEIKQIAQRIKTLRDIDGFSQENLAEYLEISLDSYKSLESGETDISVASLFKIAHKLNIEFGALLTGENPKLHQYCVVRRGHGVRVDRMKQYKYENLAFNFIHKKAEPFLVIAEPGTGTQDLSFNSHPGQEFNYVLEGSMAIYFEDHNIILHAGDSIYFDSSHLHAMKAMDNQPVKFLAIIV